MKSRNNCNDGGSEEAESLFDEFRRLAKDRMRKKIDRITITRDEVGRHTFWPEVQSDSQAADVQIVLHCVSADALDRLSHGIRNAETVQLQVDRMRHAAMWLVEEAERIETKDPLQFLQRDDIH